MDSFEMNYFESVKPTYIENWPSRLHNISIAQADVPLTIADAKALGSNMIEWYVFFPSPPGQDISHIEKALDKAIDRFPGGVFVRLGSRSPKDSWKGYKDGFRVANGMAAMEILLDASERIAEDLMLAIKNDYPPHLFVREWIDMPEWAEFRCFQKDNKLVGISQYNYLKNEIYPEILEHHESIQWAIERFFVAQLQPVIHLENVVFDVFVKQRNKNNTTEWVVKLLEINPFFEMTDPCLYTWVNGGDFDGKLRFIEGVN